MEVESSGNRAGAGSETRSERGKEQMIDTILGRCMDSRPAFNQP
jgi:hypothetical protein